MTGSWAQHVAPLHENLPLSGGCGGGRRWLDSLSALRAECADQWRSAVPQQQRGAGGRRHRDGTGATSGGADRLLGRRRRGRPRYTFRGSVARIVVLALLGLLLLVAARGWMERATTQMMRRPVASLLMGVLVGIATVPAIHHRWGHCAGDLRGGVRRRWRLGHDTVAAGRAGPLCAGALHQPGVRGLADRTPACGGASAQLASWPWW